MGELAGVIGQWLEPRAKATDPYGFLLHAAAGGSAWRRAETRLLEPLAELLEKVGGASKQELVKAHLRANQDRCRSLSGPMSKSGEELWGTAQTRSLECARRKYELLGRHLRKQEQRQQKSRLPPNLRRVLSSAEQGEAEPPKEEEESSLSLVQETSTGVSEELAEPDERSEEEPTRPKGKGEQKEPNEPKALRDEKVEVTRWFWSHEQQKVLMRLSSGNTLEAERERVSTEGFKEGYFKSWGGWKSTDHRALQELTGESVIQEVGKQARAKKRKRAAESSTPMCKRATASSEKKYREGIWYWERVKSRAVVQAFHVERGPGGSRAFSFKKYGGAEGAEAAAEELCSSFDRAIEQSMESPKQVVLVLLSSSVRYCQVVSSMFK